MSHTGHFSEDIPPRESARRGMTERLSYLGHPGRDYSFFLGMF